MTDIVFVDTNILIYERIREETGREPPVIEASDVLRHPEAALRRLCAALEVRADKLQPLLYALVVALKIHAEGVQEAIDAYTDTLPLEQIA